MVISDLKGKTLFIDTAPLIYFIEGHTTYQSILSELFEANGAGDFIFISSTITLLEVLVLPMRSGREDIASQYQTLLTESGNIEILELTKGVATTAARLRAKHNLKTPDSIQLATAIEYNADYFLTNDLRLRGIDNIRVIMLQDINI